MDVCLHCFVFDFFLVLFNTRNDTYLRWENRPGDRSGVRVPGLEMPWIPDTNRGRLATGPNDSNLF